MAFSYLLMTFNDVIVNHESRPGRAFVMKLLLIISYFSLKKAFTNKWRVHFAMASLLATEPLANVFVLQYIDEQPYTERTKTRCLNSTTLC